MALIDYLAKLRSIACHDNTINFSLQDLTFIKYHNQNTIAAEVFRDAISNKLQENVREQRHCVVYQRSMYVDETMQRKSIIIQGGHDFCHNWFVHIQIMEEIY